MGTRLRLPSRHPAFNDATPPEPSRTPLLLMLPGQHIIRCSRCSGFAADPRGGASLTQDDAKAIAAECPSVALAAPAVRGGVQVVYRKQQLGYLGPGSDSGLHDDSRLHNVIRSVFHDAGVDAAAKTAVLGETVARNLFGDSDPTGQVVIIKNVPFTVAGVLTPKGQSPTGQDQDDVILLPISTATQKYLAPTKPMPKRLVR